MQACWAEETPLESSLSSDGCRSNLPQVTCVSSGMRWRPTSKSSTWSAGLCRDAPKSRSDRRFYHWGNRISVSAAAQMLDLPEDHRRLQRLLPQVRGSARLQPYPRLALPFNLCLWPVYLLLSCERCVGISADDVWSGLTLFLLLSVSVCAILTLLWASVSLKRTTSLSSV